jgi:hypothetical protein
MQVTTPLQDPKNRYGKFVVAVVLLLLGLVVNIRYFNNFPLRSLGLLLLVVGAFLMKTSNIHGMKAVNSSSGLHLISPTRNRPGPLAWTASLSSVVALVISYIFLCQDANAGGHEAWPAYAFAGSALYGAIAWGYVVSKFF